jgi:hypothetical protein
LAKAVRTLFCISSTIPIKFTAGKSFPALYGIGEQSLLLEQHIQISEAIKARDPKRLILK